MRLPYVTRAAVAACCLLPAAFGFTAHAQDVAADVDRLVATVNGSEIRQSDLTMMYQELPEQYRQLPREMLFQQLLDQLIVRKLLAAKARDEGLAEAPDVERRLAFAEDGVLQQVYAVHYIDQVLTDDKLRAAYDQMVSDLGGQEEVNARHILVETEAEAKQLIEAVDGGADFAALAAEHSTGPSGKDGGSLGWFAAEQMVPEFSEAAFALKIGEVTAAPVQTQFGWHVIKVEDRRAQDPPSFEESRTDLRRAEANELIGGMMDEVRENADVRIFDADGNEVVEEPQHAPGVLQPAD